MAASDTASMALFCDFENVALGVRDAQYEKFDIRPVLERLLAKGSIVVKKAYCDWDRYKGFKSAMHEANFELIEIPHVRQSGKNSADIRMVVDALDLCYTKSHVDTFVIISGDSDFSPLVSKLRENAKRVIGVGVKQSCSDLLVANCDEFIYYDDLVRERHGARRENRESAPRRTPEEELGRREKLEARKTKAVELAASTFADLIADRGETERIWASVLKEVIKRRNPGFNESYFGFRSFGNLLEEAANRGLVGFGRDDKSGAYVTRAAVRPALADNELLPEAALAGEGAPVDAEVEPAVPASSPTLDDAPAATGTARRRGGRRSRKDTETRAAGEAGERPVPPVPVGAPLVDGGSAAEPPVESTPAIVETAPVEPVVAEAAPAAAPRRRAGRRSRQEKESSLVESPVPAATASPVEVPAAVEAPAVVEAAELAVAKAPRKPRTPRQARSRKPKAVAEPA